MPSAGSGPREYQCSCPARYLRGVMSGFFGHQRVKSAGVGHDRRHTRAFLGRRDIKIDNPCGVPARRRFRRARHRRPGRCRIATQLQPARRGICRVSRRLAGSYEGADDLICMNCHVDNHVAGATKLSGPCADADPSGRISRVAEGTRDQRQCGTVRNAYRIAESKDLEAWMRSLQMGCSPTILSASAIAVAS